MEKTKPIKNPPKSAKNPKIVVKTKPNQEKSTRFQESYFNPKLHKHNWEPSGKFKEKKKNKLEQKNKKKDKEKKNKFVSKKKKKGKEKRNK